MRGRSGARRRFASRVSNKTYLPAWIERCSTKSRRASARSARWSRTITMRRSSSRKRRRTLLAKALVSQPDVLLLDEPTNHLDIDAIRWLEEFLGEYKGTVLFVTHDRAFLSALSTRIVELDRGRLTSWPGSYASYVEKKAAALENEARDLERLDKKLAQEEAWLRQGVKARRTRNEGRVRDLIELRAERASKRALVETVR